MKKYVAAVILASCVAAFSVPEIWAQAYPTKAVRIVVPFAPGGGGDVLARLVGQKLTESWRYPVVIDNRGGAGGVVGSDLVAKAAPDGYTMVMGTVSTHAVAVSMYKRLPYDPAKDFAPITIVADIPNYLVAHPSVPVNSVNELIAFAKAKPGQLNYASSGNGSSGHLAMELFKSMAGIQAVHIPFKGAGPGTTALLAGEVNMQFASVLPLMPHIKSGRLKPLAISGLKRSLTLPDVPTVAEFVPGFEATTWFGLLAPAATPAPVITKIYSEVVRIINVPEFNENLLIQGANPVGNTPEKFLAHIKSEISKWAKVVKATGAQVD